MVKFVFGIWSVSTVQSKWTELNRIIYKNQLMDVTVCQVWQQVQQGRECHPQPAGAGAWPHPERGEGSDGSLVDTGGLQVVSPSLAWPPLTGTPTWVLSTPAVWSSIRLSVSDLSRAVFREGHMSHVSWKHWRWHICLPVTWSPPAWIPAIFVTWVNSNKEAHIPSALLNISASASFIKIGFYTGF